MTHKEMTAKIRAALKSAGVNAKCNMSESCGIKYIRVCMMKFGDEWTSNEAYNIGCIAKENGLTGARKSAIDPENIRLLVRKDQFNFEFWG